MPPQSADAWPTDDYYGGTKTEEVGGRKALLTHVYNAHSPRSEYPSPRSE